MKLRNDSTLSALTEEQLAQLYHWLQTLGYTETLKKAAAPPPDGFGLITHRATLHGFFKRYQQTARVHDIAAATENRSNPAHRCSDEDSSLLVSDAEHSLVHAGHQLATGPLNPDDFARATRWLEGHKAADHKQLHLQLALRQLKLAEKRHAFDREKFEVNVAHLALQHAAALQRIHVDSAAETQQKIQAARELLYGPLDQPAFEP